MTVATRPEPGPVRDYQFPRFERRKLANGLRILVAPIHKLPLVSVLAVIDAGATRDPVGQEGVARLVAKSLLEGAAGYDGDALAERFEHVGTSIDASADWDAAIVSMHALASVFPAAFNDFADVLISPTFPESGIDRLKGERVTEILHTESEPRELADEQFERFVYNDGSRYRFPLSGTKSSVVEVTRAQIVDFYANHYTPANTTLIFAGDITAAAAERFAENTLGAWQGAKSPVVEADDVPRCTQTQIHIVHRPNAPQSEIRVGHVGVPRSTKEYFPITVMNAVLGGLFGSRINLNLREEHGYTYGARSAFDWRRQAGPFSVSTAVASNVTDAAMREIVSEIARMREEPIAESELSLATAYLDGVFPIRFETTSAVANALAILTIYDLADDWHDHYRANIRDITIDDVLQAAQRHVLPDRMQFVVVGDAKAIEEPLQKLSIAPVIVHNDTAS